MLIFFFLNLFFKASASPDRTGAPLGLRITPRISRTGAQQWLWLWRAARGRCSVTAWPSSSAAALVAGCRKPAYEQSHLYDLGMEVLVRPESILAGPLSMWQASPSCVKSSFRATLGSRCEHSQGLHLCCLCAALRLLVRPTHPAGSEPFRRM